MATRSAGAGTPGAGTPGELDLETARWLTSEAGLSAVARATRHLDEGADELRAAADLARAIPEPAQRAAALTAAVARRRARERWPEADALLFTREALEQASDPVVSRHRAGRLLADAPPGSPVFDLCAGVGGDTIALARAAAGRDVQVTAVERDPARLMLLSHNVEVAGVAVTVRAADVLTLDLPPEALIHADPARRRGERRLRRLDEYVPSVPALLAAHPGAARWALAVAPGVALDDPLLPADVEVEYIQRGASLLEATLWRGVRPGGTDEASASEAAVPGDPRPDDADRAAADRPHPAPTASATLLPAGHHLAAREVPTDRLRLAAGPIGHHLVEVAPAAVRARRHDALGEAIGARRVARIRALLTTDVLPPDSPWYRSRPVVAVLPGRTRAVKRWLEHEGRDPLERAGAVEIVLHGVDTDPTRVWRELGRPPRGPSGLRLEFIRRDEDTITAVTAAGGAETA